jgi:predicted ester cyclase
MSGAEELAARDIRAFNEQDLEAKIAISSPELEFVVPGATMHGLDQAGGFAKALWEAFPDGRITTIRAAANGSWVAVEGTFTGTHAGALHTPSGAIPASGRTVEFDCAVAYEVASGRIVSKHFYFDRLELLTQIEAMPAASASA